MSCNSAPVCPLRLATITWLGLALAAAAGCSSKSPPPPDFNSSFTDLTKQVKDMSASLEAIPDKFELDTPKKVKAANQLLDDTAKRLEEQARTFHDSWETLRSHRDMSSDFDNTHAEAFLAAMVDLEIEWERVMKHNQPATDRLSPIMDLIESATAA